MTSEITWLSVPKAADMLGVATRTLYKLIDEGGLPAYRFGRVIRLQEGEVLQFIASVRVVQPGDLEHLHPEAKRGDGDRADTKPERITPESPRSPKSRNHEGE